MKFNPGAQSDPELLRRFVVRQRELDKILDDLRRHANNFWLITGPRGSGKTTLVRTLAARIRIDQQLSSQWFPILFAEEAYEISSPGEFWLECIFRIKEEFEDSSKWSAVYQSLRREVDDASLEEKAFDALWRFCIETGKRVLLVVENLQTLLSQQLNDEATGKILQRARNSERIVLLATATRLQEIDSSNAHWSDYFKVSHLHPLSLAEIRTFWASIANSRLSSHQTRPLQILTGGNPRLLLILSEFVQKNSLRELTDNIVRIVDEHTEYFRSRLESLPPVERKIFVALLELWEPSTARAISDFARLEITKTSSLLSRLVSRDMVSLVKGRGRKLFQASERLYNIYYLLRRRGGEPHSRVRLAVRFMVQFYQGEQLVDTIATIAREACRLEPDLRTDHYLAYKELIGVLHPEQREKLLQSTDSEFFATAPPELTQVVATERNRAKRQEFLALLREGERLRQEGDAGGAISRFERARALFPQDSHLQAHLAAAHEDAGHVDDAEAFYKAAMNAKEIWAALKYARFLLRFGRPEEGKAIVDRFVKTVQDLKTKSQLFLASLCHDLGMYSEAHEITAKVIAVSTDTEQLGEAWYDLAELRHFHLAEPRAAVEAYNNAIRLRPDAYWIQIQFGELMDQALGSPEEAQIHYVAAEKTIREIIGSGKARASLYLVLATLLCQHMGRRREAEELLDKCLENGVTEYRELRKVGQLLVILKRYSEAEAYFIKAIDSCNVANTRASIYEELGDLYRMRLANHSLAEKSYRNAIRQDPGTAAARIGCGWLFESLARDQEAKQMFEEAIGIEGPFSRAWPSYAKVRLKLGEPVKEVVHDCEGVLQERNRDKSLVFEFARHVFSSKRREALADAERLAREALDPSAVDNWERIYVLCSILIETEQWKEGLALSPGFIAQSTQDTKAVSQATRFVLKAAAHGFAQEAVELIDTSGAAAALEPLRTGLLLYLGKDVTTAQEISEMAQDVFQAIKEMQAKESLSPKT